MPAIQPARLKQQTANLVAKFDQPALFIRELHALLNLYSDHTHRHGQSEEPSPLAYSYYTPPPVMRQVRHSLSKMIESHPAEILALCDSLWNEQNYDLRLLAASLLGQLPVVPPHPIVDRLQTWIHSGLERGVINSLLADGLTRLQKDAPDQLIDLVTSWLHSSELSVQQAGLNALLPIINGTGTNALPVIFRLITPYIRIAPSQLRPDIIAVLSALSHCSPSETAYLLRQNLTTPNNPDTAWLIRKLLNEFPAETQAGLRGALKGAE